MTLPEALDASTVRAVAMDLDRTILPETLELRPRLIDGRAGGRRRRRGADRGNGADAALVASLRPCSWA